MSSGHVLSAAVADEKKCDEDDKEGDCDGSDEGWGFLDRACRWFNSRGFQGQIDDFTMMHAHEFEDAFQAGEKAGEHVHRFRYSDLHARYLALIEALFSDFLEKEARSAEELFSDMKDANENNYTPLFEEHRHHGFVQNLLAAMEYEEFCRLMMTAAARHGDTRGGGKRRNTPTK